MTRRVAVTGMGAISAAGLTRNALWDALKTGTSAIRPMVLLPAGSLRFPNGAEVPGYSSMEYFEPKEADQLDRFAQFALIAAREAVDDSGLVFDAALKETAAIVTGSCVGREIDGR